MKTGMSTLPDSQTGTGLDPASRLKENLTISLAPFEKDLKLRGFADVTRTNLLGSVRRYLIWASQWGIDAQEGRREDLLSYLENLRARGLKKLTLGITFSHLSTWFTFLMEQGEITQNPIPPLQKRYLRSYKDEIRQRQLISVEDAAKMVRATIDTRDRAILLLFFKTGIRRNELISLDLDDVDLEEQSLMLKPTGKRSNRLVFFDDEATRALARWIKSREKREIKEKEMALFTNNQGGRLHRVSISDIVREAAMRVDLHDPDSEKTEDRFSPHACRHWLVTHLIRAGMPRDQVKWIRGDAMREAIDIYNHIDPEDVKRNYLACIPKFGV